MKIKYKNNLFISKIVFKRERNITSLVLAEGFKTGRIKSKCSPLSFQSEKNREHALHVSIFSIPYTSCIC